MLGHVPGRGAALQLAQPGQWVGVAVMSAVAVGGSTALDVKAGVAVTLLIAIGAAVVVNPATILGILMASVFVEAISLGGIAVSRLIAPIALIVVLVELLRGRASVRFGPQLVWVAAYSTLALASALWTVSSSHTVTLLASLVIALTYTLCFAGLLGSERQLRGVLYVLALSSVVVGMVSIASFAGLTTIFNGDLQSGRAQGGVGDPNFFANLQLVAFPVLLVLAADAKRLWQQAAFGFAAIVAITSVLSTLSRGGLIALTLVLLVIPLLRWTALFASPRQKVVILLFLAVGLIGLFSRPGFRLEVTQRVTTLVAGTGEAETGASAGSGRTEIWKGAWTSIRERPLLGLGLGAFPSVSNELMARTPGVNIDAIAAHPQGIEVHSAYLGTAAELGFPGLIFFLGLLVSLGVALRRTAVRARQAGALFLSRISNALVLSLVGWAISSLFISTETARTLWIMVGISLALPKLIDAHTAAARSDGFRGT